MATSHHCSAFLRSVSTCTPNSCIYLGISVLGPHIATSAPCLCRAKILERATLECRISPTITTFFPFTLPKRYSQMIRQGLEENCKEANTIQYQLLEAMELIFKEGNPVGIKALLSLLGIGSPEVRLPLCTASDSLQQQLRAFLQK